MKIVKQKNITVTLTREEVGKLIIKHIKETENLNIERVSFNVNDLESLTSVDCFINQKEIIK